MLVEDTSTDSLLLLADLAITEADECCNINNLQLVHQLPF